MEVPKGKAKKETTIIGDHYFTCLLLCLASYVLID